MFLVTNPWYLVFVMFDFRQGRTGYVSVRSALGRKQTFNEFVKEVHQEPTKLLMYRQNAKEIKQVDGPLKNWAIFYGRSVNSQAIFKMLAGVSWLYTHQSETRAYLFSAFQSIRQSVDDERVVIVVSSTLFNAAHAETILSARRLVMLRMSPC